MRRDSWFDAIAIALAIAVRAATPSAAWIERHYSNGAYPAIDRVVRACTQPLPFCAGDVLFAIAVVWLGRYWFVALRRARGRRLLAAGRAALRTFAVACAVFVWFVLSWAYNYGRVPLADKIPTHANRTDEDSVAAFADRVTDELSRYAEAAHRTPLNDAAIARGLRPTFDAVTRRLGDGATFEPPHVKPTIFQPMMSLSATSGFTDPWTHEINLDRDAFGFERPALFAHEWAHVSGFADESEANFISVIACTTARAPFLRYSGWVLVWFNLPSDVRVTHRMSRRAYDDIVAIRARYLKNANPQVERVQRVAYDRYLKSNHVKLGYDSYRSFVRWMTGADFDAAGLPVVAASNG